MNMKQLRDLAAKNRELIDAQHTAINKKHEISYNLKQKSVKVSELPVEEQAKVIYWYSHPKRNI